MTSMDGGRTWSQPRRLPEGLIGPVKNKPVQLANGDLLSPSGMQDDKARVHFERSTDQGDMWSKTAPPVSVDPAKRFDSFQPSILVYSQHKLQALGRTGSGKILETWSKDGGKTWRKLH
jgi:hypothetical protein